MYLNIDLCINPNQSNTDCEVRYRIIKYYTVSFIAERFGNEAYARVNYTSYSFLNNSTCHYTTYPVIAECRIIDLMFVFHGQRQASSAAKCHHKCSVISDIECFHKIFQNKTEHCCLRNKIMYLFLFSCFSIFVPRFH